MKFDDELSVYNVMSIVVKSEISSFINFFLEERQERVFLLFEMLVSF